MTRGIENNRNEKPKIKPITWIIFLITFFVAILSSISIVFPALIIKIATSTPTNYPSPFEFGPLAFPLLIINFIFLIIFILYHYNRFPEILRNLITSIFNFEISKKIAFITMTSILVIYIGFTLPEIENNSFYQDYEIKIKDRVETFEIDLNKTPVLFVYFFLLNLSFILFDNVKIIPFISSVGLLILIYFISLEISKKRFAGIMSMLILLQSNLFLTFDTTPAYTTFWIFFYVFALYLIFKFWPASSFIYLLSILSKPVTILFFPLTIFFIYRSNISRNYKIYTFLTYVGIIIVGFIFLFSNGNENNKIENEIIGFNGTEFLYGFSIIGPYLRADLIISFFLLPLIVGLFLSSRKGNYHSDYIMILLSGILLSQPLIVVFTNNFSEPYRLLPLVVFFAIGVSTIFSKSRMSNN